MLFRSFGQLNAIRLFDLPAVPSVKIAPASQTIGIGGSVVLAVTPAGTGPFGYQWLRNGAPIPGANDASLALYNLPMDQAGTQYSVTVSSALGSVTSAAATVKVNPANPLLSNPATYMGMVFQGTPGGQYRVEYRTQVNTNWQTLTNLTLPSSPYLFLDLSAPANTSQRFYRFALP